MTVWVYIDGFNLYYRAVQPAGCKWLDLLSLCQKLVHPDDTIGKIKYFTALVQRRPGNPYQQYRQLNYWRALRTLGCVEIIEGRFRTETVPMPRAADLRSVLVLKTEEKRTDVNLASHLIHDAHSLRYDAALVVTGDTDLTEAIRIVVSHIGLPVHVCKPNPNAKVAELQSVATSTFDLNPALLCSSLFPAVLSDEKGYFGMPPGW